MSAPRLLLVDDEVDFAESIAELLEALGYNVTVVHSGEAAVAVAREREFDSVLLDMKMPGMNGVECMARLRQVRPGIHVVMVTAFTRGEFLNQALAAGALAIAPKPAVGDELAPMLSQYKVGDSVLLVEPDRESAEQICGSLRALDYTVNAVATCESARQALTQGKVDVLMLDFRRPASGAADLLGWLDEHTRRTTIMLEGQPGLSPEVGCCFSIDSVLVKPFQPDQLFQVLQREQAGPGLPC